MRHVREEIVGISGESIALMTGVEDKRKTERERVYKNH